MSRQQRESLEHLLRTGPLDLGGDVTEQRPLLEALLTAHPLPADVTATPTLLGGVEAVDVSVGGDPGAAAPVLLFLHGGAYAVGSAVGVAGMAADLARRAGTGAVSVGYRLAPEDPHPAAVHDALAAYRGLLGRGVPAGWVAVGGESAGGGLALALLVAARDAGLPLPACAVLFSPWVDLTLSGTSTTTKAGVDPALDAAGLARRAADYAGGADPAGPLLSPLFADLRGLPPLLVQAGSHEVLLDDAVRLAGAAAAADVAVTLQVTPEVPHVFQGFAAVLEEGASALDEAGRFLRTHLRR
ncbi:alpha/beta hydrolase fold domain-containing protein [Kineococcus gypseus]|uniref:alpha/beta hydrolase fold domain-containing protein n=1 Tax=Kineococcus gypseus TaxID=1637102 RepID=UPI003D7E3526